MPEVIEDHSDDQVSSLDDESVNETEDYDFNKAKELKDSGDEHNSGPDSEEIIPKQEEESKDWTCKI